MKKEASKKKRAKKVHEKNCTRHCHEKKQTYEGKDAKKIILEQSRQDKANQCTQARRIEETGRKTTMTVAPKNASENSRATNTRTTGPKGSYSAKKTIGQHQT